MTLDRVSLFAKDFAAPAALHRSADGHALEQKIRRLAEQGLKVRDTASALGVHCLVVARALERPPADSRPLFDGDPR